MPRRNTNLEYSRIGGYRVPVGSVRGCLVYYYYFFALICLIHFPSMAR